MRTRVNMAWVLGLAAALLCSCDPATRHKITSTIFDGVPSLPPAEEYCQDYHLAKLQEEERAAAGEAAAGGPRRGSSHRPYAEKKCDDCHDKNTESGLIKPSDHLCAVCHPNLIQGSEVHGPVSVGACLECHEPHSSAFPSLLKTSRETLCGVCHQEKRLAETMHEKVVANGMLCTDCHDPHAGDVRYFLK